MKNVEYGPEVCTHVLSTQQMTKNGKNPFLNHVIKAYRHLRSIYEPTLFYTFSLLLLSILSYGTLYSLLPAQRNLPRAVLFHPTWRTSNMDILIKTKKE